MFSETTWPLQPNLVGMFICKGCFLFLYVDTVFFIQFWCIFLSFFARYQILILPTDLSGLLLLLRNKVVKVNRHPKLLIFILSRILCFLQFIKKCSVCIVNRMVVSVICMYFFPLNSLEKFPVSVCQYISCRFTISKI